MVAEALRRWIPRLAINAAYRAVFTSPDGEKVLRDLMKRGGLLETSMVEGDPHLTAFKEGKRAVILDVLAELRWSEKEIAGLARERQEELPLGMEEEAA